MAKKTPINDVRKTVKTAKGKKIVHARQAVSESLEWGITDTEYMLVEKVLKDPLMNSTRAYSELHPVIDYKECSRKASRIMNSDGVRAYFNHRLKGRMQKGVVSEEEILFNLKSIALRCMQAEEVKDRYGAPTGEYKFEPNSAIKAWELMGKNLGMFRDRVELTGIAGSPIEIIDRSMDQRTATEIYMSELKQKFKKEETVLDAAVHAPEEKK